MKRVLKWIGIVPAGFDRFMIEHQLRIADAESEMAAARYKIEVLGPLPE